MSAKTNGAPENHNHRDGAQPGDVRAMFTRVAPHYDRINRLLSLGQDLSWRRQALTSAAIPPGGRVLDVATGTGDTASLAAQAYPGAQVVAVDLTPAMLELARHKPRSDAVRWSLGDGLALPFAESTFDAVISVFMLRNVPDVAQALREQRRVARPGGRIVCLEMTWPRRFPMTWLFKPYFFGLAPLIGRLLAGEREAYSYLPRSVQNFLTPAALAAQMQRVGLRDVTWTSKMGGTVILHVGVR